MLGQVHWTLFATRSDMHVGGGMPEQAPSHVIEYCPRPISLATMSQLTVIGRPTESPTPVRKAPKWVTDETLQAISASSMSHLVCLAATPGLPPSADGSTSHEGTGQQEGGIAFL